MKSYSIAHCKDNFKIATKKAIIAIILLISVSSFAQEQVQSDKKSDRPRKERQTPEERSQAQLAKLTAELGLNTQQQEQIKPILAEQNAKLESLRTERMSSDFKKMTAEEREVSRNQRLENQKATETKLQAILTPDQFKKWKEADEAKKAKRREAIENFENNRNNGDERNSPINIENREEN